MVLRPMLLGDTQSATGTVDRESNKG
jgi:hypothetical protein